MPFQVFNLGPDNNRYVGVLGVDEIVNAGAGTDRIIGGGRGTEGTGYFGVNLGLDFVLDVYYTESTDPLKWVGGHVLDRATNTYQEFHRVEGGGLDEIRISLVDHGYDGPDTYRMKAGKVPGLIAHHGRTTEDAPMLVKSFDARPGAQQLSIAAETMDDVEVSGVAGVAKPDGDGFRFTFSELRVHGYTDDMHTAEQHVRLVGLQYLHPSARYVEHIDAYTPEALQAAGEDLVREWHHDGALLLGM